MEIIAGITGSGLSYDKVNKIAEKFTKEFLSLKPKDLEAGQVVQIDKKVGLMVTSQLGLIDIDSEDFFCMDGKVWIPALEVISGGIDFEKSVKNISGILNGYVPTEAPTVMIHESVHWIKKHDEKENIIDIHYNDMNSMLNDKEEISATLYEFIWAIKKIGLSPITCEDIAEKIKYVWDANDIYRFFEVTELDKLIYSEYNVTITS